MKKLFKTETRVITDLNVTHVAMLPDGQFGIGGTAGKIKNKWVDRPWWKKTKNYFFMSGCFFKRIFQ